MGLFEQVGLVALDLKEVVAAFFHDATGGFSLAVQRVGGNDFAVQSRQRFQPRRRRRLFAAGRALLLVIHGHRLRGAILVPGQREQANVVANHFAVQGQRLRQRATAAVQPINWLLKSFMRNCTRRPARRGRSLPGGPSAHKSNHPGVG